GPARVDHAKHGNWLGDVLDLARAEVLKCQRRQLVSDLLLHTARKTDFARPGHALQPHSHDHAIAIEIAAVNDDVAQVYADTQDDSAVLRQLFAGISHLLLQFDRAGHRVDGAAELDEHPVTHNLDNAAVMARHQRHQDRPPPIL